VELHHRSRWKAKTTCIPFIVGIVAGLLTLGACSGGVAQTPTVATPTSGGEQKGEADTIALGAEVYAANCQVCHGDRAGKGATGGAPLHNEAGHTWHHPDAQLKEWVLNGKPGFGQQMPAFKDRLSEPDVETILAFIKTWWTQEQRQSQADISQRYQEALEKQRKGR